MNLPPLIRFARRASPFLLAACIGWITLVGKPPTLLILFGIGLGLAVCLLGYALAAFNKGSHRVLGIGLFGAIGLSLKVYRQFHSAPAELLQIFLAAALVAVMLVGWLHPLLTSPGPRPRLRGAALTLGAIVLLIVAPFIATLGWIGGGVLYNKFDQWRYSPTTEFRPDRWKSRNLKYRYTVLTHVIDSRLHPGMTTAEVQSLLGKPDRLSREGDWHYATRRPGWRFVDFSGGGLKITFDPEGRLVEAIDDTWID